MSGDRKTHWLQGRYATAAVVSGMPPSAERSVVQLVHLATRKRPGRWQNNNGAGILFLYYRWPLGVSCTLIIQLCRHDQSLVLLLLW